MDLTLVVVGYRVSEETGTALINTDMEDGVPFQLVIRSQMFSQLFSSLSSQPFTKKKTAVNTEVRKAISTDGQTINIIKTPGFYFTGESRTIYEKELTNCIDLARDGIHAFLLVVSVGTPFSKEERDLILSLQKVFGESVVNYIILVFTDGHLLEKRGQSFAEYLDQGCPEQLKDIIRLCKGRCVLFDNKKSDNIWDKSVQAQNLLSKVKTLVRTNGYWTVNTSELIHLTNKSSEERTTQRIHAVESRLKDTTTRLEQQLEVATLKVQERAEEYYKGETSELIRRLSKFYEEQMTQRLEEVESRVKNVTTRLEQQLAEAEAARIKADERAQEVQKNSSEQIQKLKEAVKRAEEVQKNSSEQIQKLREANERAQAAEKSSNEQIQKLKEADERAQEVQKNSSEQIQKLVKDVTTRLEQQLAEAEAARLKADERAEEAQKNSSEQIQKLKEADVRAQEAQKNSSERIQKLKEANERTEATQKSSNEQIQKLKEADERAQEAQKNSSEQIQKLKEADERAQQAQKNSSEQIQNSKEAVERAHEAQKNSSEQIKKLKEVIERVEKDQSGTRMFDTILDDGSTSFHVYDPSSYSLQSAMK